MSEIDDKIQVINQLLRQAADSLDELAEQDTRRSDMWATIRYQIGTALASLGEEKSRRDETDFLGRLFGPLIDKEEGQP